MKKTVFRITCSFVWLLATYVLLTACERRDLTYYLESEITVSADWSRADQEEESKYGATLIVYPQDGGKVRTVLMGDRTHVTFRLPRGRYDLVLFNRSFGDFGSIAFRGEERLETLEAYARKVDTRAGTRIIVSSPEKLATAVIRNFEVTDEMVGNYAPETTRTTCPYEACKLHFVPQPITRKVQVKLYVKGLQNLRKAQCTLGNIPLSVFLADNRPGDTAAKQEFEVNKPVFDEGSQTEGTLSGALNVFGIDTEATHDITLNALLVDGQTIVDQDLTNVSVEEQEDEEGNYILYVEASTPAELPDVKPDGGSDSGFDADVDEWGDSKVEEIPL